MTSFDAGSLLRLAQLLSRHRGPLRADFRREYGLDLDELIESRSMRPAVMLDLIDNLSPQAALWRALRPAEPDDAWDLDAQLLALITDRLTELLYVYQRTHGGKPKRPKPILRPGVGDTEPDVTVYGADPLPIDEMADWLGWPTGEAELPHAGGVARG